MRAATMPVANVLEQALESGAEIMEKVTSTFNFVGPRGKRMDFCSDCCGSNGNDCQPT